MQKISLTIGHNVGSVSVLDTPTVCSAVTTTLGVSAFTAIPCYGMWQGTAESSTRIEIVADDDDTARIVSQVGKLAWQLNQDAIMLEVCSADVEFTTASVPALA